MKLNHILKVIAILLLWQCSFSQSVQTFSDPEPSKIYEFTKYDQIPVGEYTGIPAIGVPLYTMEVGDMSIPLVLQYHAGGIKVSEEASNVGLGWNLNLAQISQKINDKDDLEEIHYTKKLLKYQDSPTIGEWPMRCNDIFVSGPSCALYGTDCNPAPEFNNGIPKVTNSIFIATGGGYPFDNIDYCFFDPLNFQNYDVEPDIFRVNFFGHSLKFIKKFSGTGQGTFEILDNKGYKIELLPNNDAPNSYWSGTVDWKIITPSGDQFFFSRERRDEIQSNSWGNPDLFGNGGGTSYTKSWSLVRIVTKKNEIVDIEYNDYGITPSTTYSQTLKRITSLSYYNDSSSNSSRIKGYYGARPASVGTEYLVNTTTKSYENIVYVSKIISSSGTIEFQYSDRIDRGFDKKLDKIIIKNSKSQFIKDFTFSYDYFTSLSTGNAIVSPPNNAYTSDVLKRLKLLSVQESGSRPYVFIYNSAVLPKKNSSAVDFWGYYNGKESNISLVPNPASLGFTDLGNNGNDKSAYVDYTKAGILEGIIYPTGGEVLYDYELNEYSKRDFEIALPNANNQIENTIKGAGLRIKSISLYDNDILQKRTNYGYSGGKYLTYFAVENGYSAQSTRFLSGSYTKEYASFTIKQFHSSNFTVPSLIGSYNAVGYDTVEMSEISSQGYMGKTVLRFVNQRDEIPHGDLTNSYYMLNLPSLMDINSVENGKILSQEVYNSDNSIVLKTEFTYLNRKSAIHYGNNIVAFRNYIIYGTDIYYPTYHTVEQKLVGYYPIYGKQSLLSSEKTTEYLPSGNKEITTNYTYNGNNILTNTRKNSPFTGEFYSESISLSNQAIHLQKNILDLPMSKSVSINGILKESISYSYIENNGITVPEKVEVKPMGSSTLAYTTKTFFDLHDDKGNIIEYHNDNDIHTCIIWGYNKTLPIARIENITYSDISVRAGNLQNASNLGQQELIAEIKSFRKYMANNYPDTFVTTYVHKPLVGPLCIENERGEKSFFVYDSYNRLKEVRDNEGNIISANEYHFKQ